MARVVNPWYPTKKQTILWMVASVGMETTLIWQPQEDICEGKHFDLRPKCRIDIY